MSGDVHCLRGLIDLHCHILPGLDDGARDLADACAMAAQAAGDGIATICATPHIRDDHRVDIAQLAERRDQLTSALRARGCEVGIAPGGEVASERLPALSDADLHAVSLGGSGVWILLEPAPGSLDRRLDRAVARLTARGLRTVIAHPERHPAEDLAARLERLAARGCLIQATADHLCQAPTAAGMLELARRGLIHVLGSDAHSAAAGRPVALSAAYAALAEVEPVARHLAWMRSTAPQAILAGHRVLAPF